MMVLLPVLILSVIVFFHKSRNSCTMPVYVCVYMPMTEYTCIYATLYI